MKLNKTTIRHLKNKVRVIRGNLTEHPGEVTRLGLEKLSERPIATLGSTVVATANRGVQLNALAHGDALTASLATANQPTMISIASEEALRRTFPTYKKTTEELSRKVKNSKGLNKMLNTEAGKKINLSSKQRLRELVQKGYSEEPVYEVLMSEEELKMFSTIFL